MAELGPESHWTDLGADDRDAERQQKHHNAEQRLTLPRRHLLIIGGGERGTLRFRQRRDEMRHAGGLGAS